MLTGMCCFSGVLVRIPPETVVFRYLSSKYFPNLAMLPPYTSPDFIAARALQGPQSCLEESGLTTYASNSVSSLYGRGFRHVLAGLWRVRRGGDRVQLSRRGDRLCGCCAGVRADTADHGVCHRAYLGLPSEPGGVDRAVLRQAVSGQRPAAVYRVAGGWRRDWRGDFAPDCVGQAGVCGWEVCLERLRAELAGRVQPGFLLHCRGGADWVLPAHYSGVHRPAGGQGFCADCDRAGADADPPDQHSNYQYVGESGTLDGLDAVCGFGVWAGEPALAVLGCADHRSGGGGDHLQPRAGRA